MTPSPREPFVALDFEGRDGGPARLVFRGPAETVVARTVAEVRPALRAVERATARGLYAAGFVAYEAAPAFDRALAAHDADAATPLVWFAIFRGSAKDDTPRAAGDFKLTTWEPSVGRAAYDACVASVRESVARGDAYQVNYTLRLRARFEGDDFAFYRNLLAAQRGRYGAYLDTGTLRVLCASPELFFRRAGTRVVTRPMKGTSRRGLWPEEDEALSRRLFESEKNRAENVMIVDLLRNDLGRVALTGSVRVESLFDIERYPTVFQMTSTVAAEVPPRTTLEEIFAALFPCGSVTGAPKVSATRIIKALEPEPRGVYCGAVGFVAPGGEAVFNVAIRTVVIDAETGAAVYGVGGGITWDSTAEGEYREALDKAALLSERPAEFELLETMRLERGSYALRERHLARLAASARYFDVPLSLESVRAALDEHAAAHRHEARRARLLVSRRGEARVESEPLVRLPAEPLPFALARTPVPRRERFLYHKTTHRAVYESRRAQVGDVFDVLLWNEEGELTEFTNGNLVLEAPDGRLWTPPVECGLLAGTFRAELLARGEVSERVLTCADLERAPRCWFVNSVRGRVRVTDVSRGRRESV
ncbi:MAG TPA: aminodeoxychorismate synthase component I [Pyrinomonadaceae bacterium]|nr:aminodeoxychorismate synthase component I [Pyrinomonadaceae bacterium]